MHVFLELANFLLQGFVLLHLSLQEVLCEHCLLLDAFRGKQIGIAQLVSAVTEVVGFYPAFFDQRLNTVIGFAETDAQRFGELALGKLGVSFNQAHQFVVGVSHSYLGTLPPYRVAGIRGLGQRSMAERWRFNIPLLAATAAVTG